MGKKPGRTHNAEFVPLPSSGGTPLPTKDASNVPQLKTNCH